MRRINSYILLASILSFGIGAVGLLAQQPDTKQLMALNHQALIPLSAYATTYNRGLADYVTMLGPDYLPTINALEPNAIVVDAGAGLGVAMMPLVAQLGVYAYAINGTDMLGPVYDLGSRIETTPALLSIKA